jgi:cytochrome b
MKLYAVEENAGPFANMEMNLSPVTVARADDDEGEEHEGHGHDEGDEFWETIHEFFANFTLLLVVLHIGGVVFSSMSHNENLPRAMLTGKKRRER